MSTKPVREVVDRLRVDNDRWRVPIIRTYYTAITLIMMPEIYSDDIVDDWYPQRVID